MSLDQAEYDLPTLRAFLEATLAPDSFDPIRTTMALAAVLKSIAVTATEADRLAIADQLMTVASELIQHTRQRVN